MFLLFPRIWFRTSRHIFSVSISRLYIIYYLGSEPLNLHIFANIITHTHILNGRKYFQSSAAIPGTLVIINDLQQVNLCNNHILHYQQTNKNRDFCSCSGSQDPASTFKVKYFFITFPPKVIFLINSFILVKSGFCSVVILVLSCRECDF